MKPLILFLFMYGYSFALSASCERSEAMRDLGCYNGCSSVLSAPLSDNGCSSALSVPLREIGCSPDSLPELNRTILSFVDSKMNKKVGRGECWDLAAEALNAAGAKWNGKLQFGRKLEKGEEILPGDIIQFEGVKIKFEEGNARYTQLLKHHTGIVYSMKGEKQFDMANQNTEAHGKKVSITFIDLDKISTGHYFIYRAVR